MISAGVAAASYAAAGDRKQALIAAGGIAAAGIGAGGAVMAYKGIKGAGKAGLVFKVTKKVLPGVSRKATGFTKHGWERAWGSRGDGGITTPAIYKILKTGQKSYRWSNHTWQYKAKGGFVSLNWRGKVVNAGVKKNQYGRNLKRY